jgi:pimeloyl-ACP methyl ester carboxylesterase
LPAESHHISFRSSELHYLRWGTGPDWLFCFHGYGEDSRSFLCLEKELAADYTVIALDLPFHGKTKWREGLLLEPADLMQLVNQLRPTGQPFHLMGYSMGGRVALQLLQLLPDQIKSILLVAPDGLHKKIWQRLATHSLIGKRLFKQVMDEPKWLLGTLDLATRLGLYNPNLLRFVHYYLDESEAREMLYQRWTTMRKFKPNQKLLKQIIWKNRISVNLVFGRYDRVILTRYGKAFSKNSEGLIRLTELEAGHQLLREKYAALLAGFLVK